MNQYFLCRVHTESVFFCRVHTESVLASPVRHCTNCWSLCWCALRVSDFGRVVGFHTWAIQVTPDYHGPEKEFTGELTHEAKMQVEAKAKAMVGLAESNGKNVPKGNLLQPWQANVDNLRAHEQYKHP